MRKSITKDDVYRLDDTETHVWEIIKDLAKMGMFETDEDETLVIRQARREGISERNVKTAMGTLKALRYIK